LAIDQGTTNSKALLVSDSGAVLASGNAPVALTFPSPGWVEQDADDLWGSVLVAVQRCLTAPSAQTVETGRIEGLAISAQRESVVAWRRSTGASLGPVVGWQDTRTSTWCAALSDPDADALVSRRTGLRIDPMFSAPKISWLLRHASAGVPQSDICVGTVDAWLVWRLTGGRVHACDAGNASRTLLYDVVDLQWSAALLDLFGIPTQVLPEVRPSNGQFGSTLGVPGLPDGIPILAVLADSHAALYGQGCTEVGMAKATYGTGSSVMTPTSSFVPGGSPVPSTLAWLTDRPTYAREGNIVSSGATLVWTAQLLGLTGAAELVRLAEQAEDPGSVVLVPAFSGLGAPHWDRGAQAVLVGMTQATPPAMVALAAVYAVAHQICDVVEAIERDGAPITVFRADGGATASALLMQTQADLLRRAVEVADVAEVSALGAARMAWSALGSTTAWPADTSTPTSYYPGQDEPSALRHRDLWRQAVGRSRLREASG